MDSVLVYCELEGSQVAGVSLELLTKGRTLASRLGVSLEAVAAGYVIGSVPAQVIKYGVDVLHLFDDAGLAPYTTAPHSAVLEGLIRQLRPQIVLIGATVIGRDLGPRVSSALGSGLTADCTELEIGDYEDTRSGATYGNLLYQIRPAFGGNIIATIVNPEHRPQMATVRQGVMRSQVLDENYKGRVVSHSAQDFITPEMCLVKVLERHLEMPSHHLDSAPVVIAGGYGMGSRENFDMLFELAGLLHGEVGASRAAVDAGFADHDRQIGQTGITVRPRLYIACGISGQIQHVAGMRGSNLIVSINQDPDAPINAIADYVITGRVEDVLPRLIAQCKSQLK